jgi:YVTN family beta-propeller protein
VTIDGGGGTVYVVNQGGNSVTMIDAATETVIGAFAVGTGPGRLFEDADRLLVLNANGGNPDTLTVATKQYTVADTEGAGEYYHPAFDHYFHTASQTEIRLLNDGVFDDRWIRTYEYWRVWIAPGPGRVPVCRFFSPTFAPKSSHFYTPYPAECAALQTQGVWQLESDAIFYVALTDASGNCPNGTVPLYRVYNDGAGDAPNHRYTVSRSLRDQMVAAGWSTEGNGVDTIFACLPPVGLPSP